MKIYNTLSRKKEEFKPQVKGKVKMYVCGVTPYSDAHIGHAMSYINFDVIRRYLTYKGYEVSYVQNITDIDDKIINRAISKGISTNELAGEYAASFSRDMEALNVMKPDKTPKATEEIDKILEVVKGLVDKGYAYESGGSVYFRVRKMADYGKLSRQDLDQMRTGARIEPGEEKEDPMDFVLWKASKPGEPSWKSPWGQGRPGWHIECSAMSMKYLGDTLDIHGGGQDLIFPHHENEIAQSECFTGKPFVRYWMHNGLLQLGEDKMSKSLGNLITIKEALEKYSADAIRLFVLNSHYRSPLKFSEEVLQAAEGGLKRLKEAKHKKRDDYSEMSRLIMENRGEKIDVEKSADSYRELFIKAMDDDFNTPQALAVLFDLASEINRAVNLNYSGKTKKHYELFEEITKVLGFKLEKGIDEEELPLEIQDKVNELIVMRDEYRKQKNWQKADEIRDKLMAMGVTPEDTPEGTKAVFRRRSD